MTGSLRVSVIVPTFDRARYLRACVESLLAQTVRPDEILVVDDGSRDETPAVVASFGERLRHEPGERVATWLLFNRMLAEELHATLALGEYLVPPRRSNERRTAALARLAGSTAPRVAARGARVRGGFRGR